MNQRIALLLLGLPFVIIGAFLFFFFQQKQPKVETPPEVPSASTPEPAITMKIESSVFQHNERIPPQYTCDGANINPALTIADVPAEAKSLVLIMDDPDAPRGTLRPGSGQAWVHWTMWSIAPGTKEIAENSVPAGAIEGLTSFGKPGYGGPCPPRDTFVSRGPLAPDAMSPAGDGGGKSGERNSSSGAHRYFFKLYALDTALDLSPEADKTKLDQVMAGHILAKAELVGLYQR